MPTAPSTDRQSKLSPLSSRPWWKGAENRCSKCARSCNHKWRWKLFTLFVTFAAATYSTLLVWFALSGEETQYDLYTAPGPPRAGGKRERFPKYGTVEFSRYCNWTQQREAAACSFLVRPKKSEHEGISMWVTHVTMGYLLARQAGCRLFFDYGPDVDIRNVLMPAPDDSSSEPREQLNDWEVPPNFQCLPEWNCFEERFPDSFPPEATYPFAGTIPGRDDKLAPVPRYRFAYGDTVTGRLYREQFMDLERALPGFRPESGMACSLGNLFHVAPDAAKFEPRLFTEILPTLRDDSALVLAIYIRTGRAETSGEASPEDTAEHRHLVDGSTDCALSLERQYLSGKVSVAFSRIVWMLVTDSQDVKDWVTASFDTKDAHATFPSEQRQMRHQSLPLPRKVLVTSSHGAHTKTERKVSTADFAEALIDWYLIGESDVVVARSGYSFGMTAAMRTARPVYHDNKNCSRGVLIHEGVMPFHASRAHWNAQIEKTCKVLPKNIKTAKLFFEQKQYTVNCS